MCVCVSVVVLYQVIGCSNIIKPEFSWKMQNANMAWDSSKDVCTTLECPQQVQVTCPLNLDKEGIVFIKQSFSNNSCYDKLHCWPSVTTQTYCQVAQLSHLSRCYD